MVRAHVAVVLTIVFSIAWVSPSFAQIYKWRDPEGNLRFADTPPSPGVKAEKMKMRETSKEEAPPGKTAQEASPGEASKGKDERAGSSSPRRSYPEIKVIMYMTDWCPYCRKAREYLNSLGVKVTEYNIEREPARNKERARKAGGGSGVPVIDVEGIIIKGYSREMIKDALEKRSNK
ncbi:MAG: DUF4124 domain-containing protein [Deltaproteobacteria bacterium]|nr:DUF4124 domain-containing protein [Deltaproteobacteria bacterium]